LPRKKSLIFSFSYCTQIYHYHGDKANKNKRPSKSANENLEATSCRWKNETKKHNRKYSLNFEVRQEFELLPLAIAG